LDLPLRFFLEGEHYVLVEGKDAAWLDDDDFEAVGPWEAQRVLAGALAQSDAHALLRAGLSGQATGSGWDDHHGFSRRVRTRLDEDPERLVLLRRRRPIFSLVWSDPIVDDLADLVPGDDRPEDTWIEVLVVDEEDVPVAGIDYEIELSDGRVRRGRTSEHGILRYEGMPPGSCKLKLLSVEAKGWDRA
jgi:hypothetical protein